MATEYPNDISLVKSLYDVQDSMAKSIEVLRKRSHFTRDDFPAGQNSQMAVSHGVVPVYRGPTPAHPIRQGLPYKDDDVPDILPKFRKGAAEGRILLSARDAHNGDELFLSCPTTKAGKKLHDRTISSDRRIVWIGGYLNLFTP